MKQTRRGQNKWGKSTRNKQKQRDTNIHTHRNTTKHKTPSQDLQDLKKDTIKNSSDSVFCQSGHAFECGLYKK